MGSFFLNVYFLRFYHNNSSNHGPRNMSSVFLFHKKTVLGEIRNYQEQSKTEKFENGGSKCEKMCLTFTPYSRRCLSRHQTQTIKNSIPNKKTFRSKMAKNRIVSMRHEKQIRGFMAHGTLNKYGTKCHTFDWSWCEFPQISRYLTYHVPSFFLCDFVLATSHPIRPTNTFFDI